MPNGRGWIYVRKYKTKAGDTGHWDQKKHVEAITTYLATGNMQLTSRITNVPFATLNNWKTKDWWSDIVNQLQEEGDLKLSASLEKTRDKAITHINDILENGDYLYDVKKGKIVRIPAKLKDVHRIASDLVDKQILLRKQDKSTKVSPESTEGRLLKLAESFAEMALRQPVQEKVVSQVIEGEYENLPPNYREALQESPEETINAVHVRRQEGLQEGIELGTHQETIESQGQGSSQQGQSIDS